MARGLQIFIKDPTGGKGTVRSAETGQFIRRDVEVITRSFMVLAEQAQANVVSNIQGGIRRRSASTGRLLRVTAAAENRYADQFGFGVGVLRYLDKSEAKYWRTIEEGSARVWSRPFIGTQLYPKGPGKPPFPVAHGASPGLRTYNLDGEGVKWMDGSRFVVKREIRPMHAYQRAADQGGIFTGKAASVVAKYLQSIVRQGIAGR